MSQPQIEVVVRTVPSKVDGTTLDNLIDAVIGSFEGTINTPLISVERGILKNFLLYTLETNK